ncbi:MAG TPA: insulinase family protein, partial [Rubricoccaceae bacterium]|nr:insulinase family protein [Rubricoccaceae bacterium]
EPTPSAPNGTVASQSRYPVPRVWEWRLTNGARVVFRPLDSVQGRVQLFAFAPGGAGLAPDSVALSAAEAAEVVAASLRAPEGVSLMPRLTETEARLIGDAPADQLVNLLGAARDLFRAPPADADAYRRARRDALAGGLVTADVLFPLGGPRHAVRTPDDVGEVDVAVARSFFREVYDPGRFTFLLVGDTTPEAVEAAAGVTLGRLRSAATPSEGEVTAPEPPPASTIRLRSAESGTRVTVVFAGPRTLRNEDPAAFDVLASLLEHRLEGAAREVTGEALADRARGYYTLQLTLSDPSASPEDLRVRAFDAVRALAARGPSATEITAARGEAQRAARQALETSSGLLAALADVYRRNGDPREALEGPRRVAAVSAERVRALAREVLDVGRAYVVIEEGP